MGRLPLVILDFFTGARTTISVFHNTRNAHLAPEVRRHLTDCCHNIILPFRIDQAFFQTEPPEAITVTSSNVRWMEHITRGAPIALMHNFTSVSDALKELVDNAIDHRRGQHLQINIHHSKRNDRVIVESDGGRGMGPEDIQTWLTWGEGEEHDDSHIGKYYQGGKAACGFLGTQVRLWAKRLDSDEVWLLEDQDWGTRTKPKDFGLARPIPKNRYPTTMVNLPNDRGHVRIEVAKLNKEKRWRLDDLKRALSSTYRTLLTDGALEIKVSGDDLTPLELPLSTAAKKIEIDVQLAKRRRAFGWAGRVRKDELTRTIKSGLRLVVNGRLVKEGEWFGVYYEGKGALNSFSRRTSPEGLYSQP